MDFKIETESTTSTKKKSTRRVKAVVIQEIIDYELPFCENKVIKTPDGRTSYGIVENGIKRYVDKETFSEGIRKKLSNNITMMKLESYLQLIKQNPARIDVSICGSNFDRILYSPLPVKEKCVCCVRDINKEECYICGLTGNTNSITWNVELNEDPMDEYSSFLNKLSENLRELPDFNLKMFGHYEEFYRNLTKK